MKQYELCYYSNRGEPSKKSSGGFFGVSLSRFSPPAASACYCGQSPNSRVGGKAFFLQPAAKQNRTNRESSCIRRPFHCFSLASSIHPSTQIFCTSVCLVLGPFVCLSVLRLVGSLAKGGSWGRSRQRPAGDACQTLAQVRPVNRAAVRRWMKRERGLLSQAAAVIAGLLDRVLSFAAMLKQSSSWRSWRSWSWAERKRGRLDWICRGAKASSLLCYSLLAAALVSLGRNLTSSAGN